jgi:hypothetical protein
VTLVGFAAVEPVRADPAPNFPEMTFVRVRGSDPSCQTLCPEWIAAQGMIVDGTAKTFADFVAGLGGRRLPVLIHSPGGVVKDALAMGRLIRARHLAVGVARTRLEPCPPPATECADRRGEASAVEGRCASACPLVLAAGIERYASPQARIGVHQMFQVVRRQYVNRRYEVQYQTDNDSKREVSRKLTSEDQFNVVAKERAGPETEADVEAYLKEMGIGPQVMDMIELTPPTDIQILRVDDLRASRLVTVWIDGPSAIVAGLDANGLAGGEGEIVAKGGWPFAVPFAGQSVAFEATFAYRRGGGDVAATLSAFDPATKTDEPGRGFTVSPRALEYPLSKPANGGPTRYAIPLAQFCRLSGNGRADVTVADALAKNGADANGRQISFSIDFGSAAGMQALFGEACGAPPGAHPT